MIENRFSPLNRIRRQEIRLVIDELQIRSGTRILEVGCGSGLQSTFLAEKSNFVVSSDIALNHFEFGKLCLVKCSGEYLPFKDSYFDIVYSSNVLEHIKNRNKALREMGRVMKREGILVCVVPTFTWKILQLILYYLGMIHKFTNLKMKNKRQLEISLVPSVHGKFKGNVEEIRAYLKKNWICLLESNGFTAYKIKKLLLYAPLGKLRTKNITILPPSLKLEKITGLCSSIALFATLKNFH